MKSSSIYSVLGFPSSISKNKENHEKKNNNKVKNELIFMIMKK